MAVSLSIPSFIVNGHIFDRFNTPIANAKVQAFDKDLRSEQLLGEKFADSSGLYSITISSVAASARESKTPDIFIRVFDSTGKALGQSPVFFNNSANITIDFKEGNAEIKPMNEFDALVQLIQPLVASSNLQIKDLVEKAPNHDISFLAGESGQDQTHIDLLVKAFQVADEAGKSLLPVTTPTNAPVARILLPAVFYGLFRQGFPVTLNELLQIKADSIKKAILQAMDENIVSTKLAEKLDDIIKLFNDLSVKKVVDGNNDQSAVFKKLFGPTLSADQQKTFTSTYFDHEDQPEIFWGKLKQQPGFSDGVAVEKAKRSLSLYLLTSNQPELAQYLFSKQSSDPDLKEMSGYAKFSKADWKEQITNAAILKFPVWVKGETNKEKTEHYAESLEQLHKQLYPTTFFAARMKQDGQSAFVLKEQLNLFFGKNPGFDLNTKNIKKQFEHANFDGINKDEIKKELKKLNRLYKLTDNYKQINELYRKQLFSSADIVKNYGREQFVTQFAAVMGGAGNAEQLYKKAVSVSNKTTALIIGYKTRHDIKVYGIDGGNAEPAGYHEMFGDGELCECEHCQSVYSPAAYFVDVLAFIKRENETAYYELIRRRPDLDDILLTCKNTNTPLPYIDLVNELLEKEVVKLSRIEDSEGITAITHSYQTEGTAAELIAMPEHSSSNAYEPLKTVADKSAFSSTLPIDMPLEEIRIYSEKLGWKRYVLMDIFYGNNDPGRANDANLAKELFEFSNAELDVINGRTEFTVTLPLDATGVTTIKALLDKTKFSYIELLQLLETNFLNLPAADGARPIQIKQIGEVQGEVQLLTCNLEKLKLTGASNEWLNKAVRFTRFLKKIEWNIFDLDRALTVLDISDFQSSETLFNEKLLIPFAHIEKTKRLLNIPVRQVISFLGDIDTAKYIDHTQEAQPVVLSLYDELFGDAVLNNASVVCASFGISATEYAPLQNSEDFSLPNLSRIYRHVLLAKVLKISINELKEFIRITGNRPAGFAWTPEKLSEFLDQWKVFKSTGINSIEFKGYFNAASDEEYTIPVDYRLVKAVTDCTRELIVINNNTVTGEEDRKVQSTQKIKEFLQTLSNNRALTEALSGALSNPPDIAVKTVVENYLGEKNLEILSSLPAGEMILKLETLRKSLYDYIVIVLKKAPAIFDKLKFKPEETLWLKNNKELLGIDLLWGATIDFENETFFKAFSKLYYLSALAKIRSSSLSWIDLPEIAINNREEAKVEWFQTFINLYSVAETSLKFLCGPKDEVNNKGRLNFSFPQDYINAENLASILNCCRIIKKLGGNNQQLNALLSTTILPTDTEPVQNLLKSKYGNKEWLDVIKPINDRLRTRRRDALVAWLLANTNNGGWYSTNDIYEWLLIDTEMDACMVTSRIKQSISSIQLFIDRCLMNLEKDEDHNTIILGKKFSEQWHQWRKQYRVWEANRKIFLYPENWIEPDLRDDKSSFFKELEGELKQNEVTEDIAKQALINYLQKLDAVANLEMVGLFNDEETKIVHVFGRTHNIPHQYFYRKQENSIWSAWEKVEVDIEGDHILPVVWNGRLMLFWAQFAEKQVEGSSSTSLAGENGNMTLSSSSPKKYLEMKLAWSEYKNGKWKSKKVSKELIKVTDSLELIFYTVEQVSMSSLINNEGLFIRLIVPDNITSQIDLERNSVAAFYFSECASSPKVSKRDSPVTDQSINILKIPKAEVAQMFLVVNAIDGAENLNGDGANINGNLSVYTTGLYTPDTPGRNDPVGLFDNASGTLQLLPNHHEVEKDKSLAFFYSNEKNNFYAEPVTDISPQVPDEVLVRNTNIMRITPVRENSGRSTNGSNGTLISLAGTTDHGTNTESLHNFLTGVYQLYVKKEYHLKIFYHPFVCSFIKIVNQGGIEGLYTKDIQDTPVKLLFSDSGYKALPALARPYPVEELDFTYTGSYSMFNWELFYHIPLLVATRLTQNQKFEEARKWYHYIFDPTRSSGTETGGERFWITKPFRKEIEDGLITLEDLLNREENAHELDAQIANWENNLFNPHAVARLRISAYMRNTVLRYIDNLIKWGDQLFGRDTIESINEATLLYILASNILGKRIETVPQLAKASDKSFSNIKDNLDRFSSVKVEIESYLSPSSGDDNILMPYFCLPKNDYLDKYWDTVADRLFKIRHCMNIEGVVRQLPLFEPPLDPALLMRAKDAGLDLNTILNDINIGLPNYRFQIMLQKANELCNDVKVLGGLLLSALEKKDAEELSLLRSSHELNMLEMIRDVKEKQRDEAEENLNSLNISRTVIEERQNYYSSREFMNTWEALYFQSSYLGLALQTSSAEAKALAATTHLIPDLKIGSGFTVGATTGGTTIGDSAEAAADSLSVIGFINSAMGLIANTFGAYQRRMDDWKFQAKSAELELKQIDKQILAAEIRLAIAEKELENHNLQMEQSREVDDYMRGKFTNEDLYDYMVGQLSNVYFQSYQLAYTTAKKAEKCLQHELGIDNTNYVQFGYWDNLKKGLLSGEKLQYDLRRLENAYLEENKREFEITKHISLVTWSPKAIIDLKNSGKCNFFIPEILFEMDYPGHCFRRIKSISMSIPCITGPYTSLSSQLSLSKSYVRKKDSNGDELFDFNSPSESFIQGISTTKAIATSNGQADAGMFEFNFRDERYLPFEGAGVISEWNLELPTAIRQFDYNSISDVIMTFRYTAQDSDKPEFKNAVNEKIKAQINSSISWHNENGGMYCLFSLKNNFPDFFHKLNSGTDTNVNPKELAIGKLQFPFVTRSFEIKYKNCQFYLKEGELISNDVIKAINSEGETIDDAFKLKMEINITELAKLDDVLLYLNYTLE